jgi:hypothetical protein
MVSRRVVALHPHELRCHRVGLDATQLELIMYVGVSVTTQKFGGPEEDGRPRLGPFRMLTPRGHIGDINKSAV